MRKHSFRISLAFIGGIAGALLEPTGGSAQLEQKPDLQAFPAFDLAVVGDELIFSTLTWNSGEGPLEIVAREIGTLNGSDVRNVSQFVYKDDGTYYERHAGTFEYHLAHAHFHFEKYAHYTLKRIDSPGQSDRIGSKTTFCIIDTNRIDRRLPGAPKRPAYRSCSNDFQGMSVGWGDEYGSHLAGQEIDVTNLPEGDYSLTIEVDPNDRLLETNENNNTSCVLLHISVASQSVAILDDSGCGGPGGGEVTISTIEPFAVERGSVEHVTITGSGFVEGVAVTFENGSGPRPKASDVNVVDANMITAYVTVKNSGPPNTQVWDVRVGSGVLPVGLTVF